MKAALIDNFTVILRGLNVLLICKGEDLSQLPQFSKGKRGRSGTRLVHNEDNYVYITRLLEEFSGIIYVTELSI